MARALHGKYASAGGLRYLGHPEAVPNPDKKLAFPVHGELITRNGIFNHENLVFD